MANHIHAIMILKEPAGPLVYCKIVPLNVSEKGISILESLKLDLLMFWYRERYPSSKYSIETAGFENLEHFFRKHPECEKFLKAKKP